MDMRASRCESDESGNCETGNRVNEHKNTISVLPVVVGVAVGLLVQFNCYRNIRISIEMLEQRAFAHRRELCGNAKISNFPLVLGRGDIGRFFSASKREYNR